MRSISALDNTERQALEDALEDEYKAHTTYAQVIQDLGAVLPFLNIVDAETRHVSALLSLFEKCGIAAPPNRWPGKVPRFPSVEEACAAAVQGEINNVALYDRVLKLPGGPTSSPCPGPALGLAGSPSACVPTLRRALTRARHVMCSSRFK